MKKQIQLAIKEGLEELTYNGDPVYDSVVANIGEAEDENDSNDFSGLSTAVIVLKNVRFDEKALNKGFLDTQATGFITSVHKSTHPNAEDLFEVAPELITKMFVEDRTLGGLVRDILPTDIEYNLFRSDILGVLFLSELRYRVLSRFFIEKDI